MSKMTATMPTPLLHTLDPVALTIRDGWRGRNEYRLDRSAVTWNNKRLAYDDIETVAYCAFRRPYNLVQRRLERRVRLGARRGGLELRLGVHAFGPNLAAQHHDAYRLLLTTLHALVEPRLRAQVLRTVAVDHAVDIGALRLSAGHLENTHTGERVEWRQLPSAQLEKDQVVVRVAVDHDTHPLARLSMLTPNAPLLPELLDEAAITFS